MFYCSIYYGKLLNGIVLAELASFMEQAANNVDEVFKVTKLGKMTEQADQVRRTSC